MDSQNITGFPTNLNCTIHPDGDGCREEAYNNFLGLGLTVSSSIFIGTYWILNKKSLENLAAGHQGQNFNTNTNDSSSCNNTSQNATIGSNNLIQNNQGPNLKYEFLKSRLWWFGMLCMALGEFANFAAYQVSPAALVTPLGALSVVVTCVLSEYFLDERMNLFSKLGVLLAVLGSVFIALHAPHIQPINDLGDLKEKYLLRANFLIYVTIVFSLMVFLLFMRSDGRDHTHHYFYKVLLASLAGGFCVISTKCIGVAIQQSVTKGPISVLSDWITYVVVITMVGSISLQIVQITRALNTQSASTVMPIFYVTFTISVVLGMNILFEEYKNMDGKEAISVFIGFTVLCCAVFLLQGFRDLPIYSLSQIDDYSLQIKNLHISNSKSQLSNNYNKTQLKGLASNQINLVYKNDQEHHKKRDHNQLNSHNQSMSSEYDNCNSSQSSTLKLTRIK